jgi:hypothetical protein
LKKYNNSEKFLEKLELKTREAKEKLQNDNSIKNNQLKNIISYLNLKTKITLYDLIVINSRENNFENSLSLEDKELVNKELIKIQLNLLENTTK